MTTDDELIGAQEAAEILKISYSSLRDYKKRGLIAVATKSGNKDLYSKVDVARTGSIIIEKRKQGFSLSQISLMLSKEPINVISLPGPREPEPRMTNQELLHGFLRDLYGTSTNVEKAHIDELCKKWDVHYTGE